MWLTQFKGLSLYLHVEKVESCHTAFDKVFSLSVITVSSKIWCGGHISYVFCCKDQIISLYLCIFGHEITIFTYNFGSSFITPEMVRCLLLLVLLLQLGRLANLGKNTVVSDVCVNTFEILILWYLIYNVDGVIVSKSVLLSVSTYSIVGAVVSDI